MTFERRALELINEARAAQGLVALQSSPALEKVARDGDFHGCGGQVVHGRCLDMGERHYFSHSIKNCGNKSFSHMLVEAGIGHSGVAENVAFVSATDDEDVAASNIHGQFMADLGHRNNILSTTFTHVGIGMWRTPPGEVWRGIPPPAPPNTALTRVFISTQIFARNPVAPEIMGGVGATYHSVTPSRVLDTRTATGVPQAGPVGAQQTLNVKVTGSAGVPPSGASAVVLNVAVTNPTASGFLTVFPTGEDRPLASNLNFTPGLTVSNMVIAKLGTGGRVSIFNLAGTTDVVADVAGWFDGGGDDTGSRYHPVAPSRILDSRIGTGAAGPIGPGATLDLAVLSRGGLPAAGVAAVAFNLTATQPTASGFLTVFPTGGARPLASSLNFDPGKTVPNLVVAMLGAGGSISIFNPTGTTQVIADVAGWFDQGNAPGGTEYHPVTPARILDTRTGNGAPVGQLGAGATMNLQVAGAGGIPGTGVGAVVVNVTVAGPTAESFLTVFPAGDNRPNAANLNFVAGQIVPNLVMAKLGTGGRLSIFNHAGSTHVIADVTGWFDAG